MSGTPWALFTGEQQRAAFLVHTHVLASAGAGSGKTAVMAVRYVACLLDRDGERRITPDRILALAFTNEAAGNLRARIDRTLRAVLRYSVFPRLHEGELTDLQLDEESRSHLRRCLAALPGAPITTVDGACLTWVTEGAAQLGRDPDHAPAENLAWARLRIAAWQAVCRTQSADLAPLIERYGEHNVRNSLIGRADQAAALPGGDAVLDDLDPYAELLRRRAVELTKLPAVIRAAQAIPGKGKIREFVQSLTTVVPTSPAGLISWLEAIDETKVHASNPELAEQVRLLQDLLDAPISRSADGARPPAAQRRGGATLGSLRDWSPAMEQELTVEAGRVVRLLAAMRDAIAAESATAGVAGFAAIEVDALRLLEDPRTAARLARRYRHVLLDEAQDLNRLQARLIEALQTADGPRIFTVGDHRQSIFGFRHAAPEIFGRWESELVGRGGTVATLRENFRSHPDLVRKVTGLFNVEAFRPEDIQPGREGDGEAVLAAHVVLSGNPDPAALKEDPAELQAAFVAERIAGSSRPPEDHAILLRSRTRMALFARALERRGLPCDTDFPEGLVDSQEVHDIEAVLRLVANPADRTALAIALGGPWGTTDPQDKRLMVTALETDPTAALRQTSLGELLPLIRARVASEGPASAVRALATDARLTARYGALPLARRRLANLMLLAEEEQRAGQVLDLTAFCDRLRERRAYGVDEATASGAALGGRGVRLMTIHGAKGLEWPVVWLPGLDRPHNQRDLAQPVLAIPAGDHLRIACRPETRPDRRDAQPISLRAGLLADDLRVRAIGEERRLFYVACTRAREELHLLAGKVPSAPDARQLTSSLGGWVSGAGTVPWVEELVDLRVVSPAAVPPPPRIPATTALPLPDTAPSSEVRSVTDLVEDDVASALGGALGYEATISRLVGTTIHEGFARCGCGMTTHQADEILAPLLPLLPAERIARLRAALTATDLVPGYWSGERLVEQPLIGELDPGKVLTAQPDLLVRDAAGWHLYDFKTGAAAERASSRLQVQAYAWLVAPLLDAPLVDAWLIDVEGRRRLPVACPPGVEDELRQRWRARRTDA